MEQKVTISDEPSFKSTNTRQLTLACEQEAVAGATEQAKDAVQQAGEQVRTRLKELESMQLEIDRLKQAPVSVSEDAQNQLRIQQLERDVLQVQQEINVHLEIAEQEVKEVRFKNKQFNLPGYSVYLTNMYPAFAHDRRHVTLQAVLQAQASFNPQEANQCTSAGTQVGHPQADKGLSAHYLAISPRVYHTT